MVMRLKFRALRYNWAGVKISVFASIFENGRYKKVMSDTYCHVEKILRKCLWNSLHVQHLLDIPGWEDREREIMKRKAYNNLNIVEILLQKVYLNNSEFCYWYNWTAFVTVECLINYQYRLFLYANRRY